MKTALFINFTEEEFIGYWGGKGKKFKPGEKVWMPDYLADHFAKHLVNRELQRTKSDGSLVIKDGDKMTSPKKPWEFPVYMELYNKAYQPDEVEELGDEKDDIDALIGAANKNREKELQEKQKQSLKKGDEKQQKQKEDEIDSEGNQVIKSPDFDSESEEE